MIAPRWKKVLTELWFYKTRTLLVVVSIAVGVFATTTILIARDTLLRELRESFLAINPVSATITTEPFDDRLVDTVRHTPGVAAAEGQRRMRARVELSPNQWYDLDLYVLPDDATRTVNTIKPNSGVFPPPRHTVAFERSVLPRIGYAVGDTVLIEPVNGETRRMPITGTVHDLSIPPAAIAGRAFGYIDYETYIWLGGTSDYTNVYNQMQIVVAENPTDERHIWHVAHHVADRIERSGRTVAVIDVPTPQQHPVEAVLPTILTFLAGLGVLSLVLAGFLITNTIEAILAQQVRQIGILKAVGASQRQVRQMYMVLVMLFGMLALLVAVPLGSYAALGFSRFMGSELNVDITRFVIPWHILFLVSVVSLVGPVLVALPSIAHTNRISVREALDNQGGAGDGNDRLTRLLQRLQGLPRPMLLAIRNTFRSKPRLLRTLGVLALGGAIVIAVLTLQLSMNRTLDATQAGKLFDIEVRTAQPHRIAYLTDLVLQVPGVAAVEPLQFAAAYPRRPDGSDGEEINLYAIPVATPVFDLEMKMGRWLLPADDRAIVLTSNYLQKEPGTEIGDVIVLEINDREQAWQIVGITREFVSAVNPAVGYVNYAAYAQAVGSSGTASALAVTLDAHDPEYLATMTQRLEAALAQQGVEVSLLRSVDEERNLLRERFNLLTVIFALMAVMIGSVGGLGLMGTMSINVIERTREIGIMRAIGASNAILQQLVIGEALLIGVFAWLLGWLVSLPIALLMTNFIGRLLLNEPFDFHFAWYAVLVWLVLVLLIAVLASYLPARSAARMTIREVLAFE